MAVFEKILSEFKNGISIRRKCWSAGEYIKTQNGKVFLSNSKQLITLSCESLLADDWEIYQEPIDWDYIIKNKCLCWFWNNTGKTKYLSYLQAKEEYVFRDEQGACWENCRPVRRDEVTFYENEY